MDELACSQMPRCCSSRASYCSRGPARWRHLTPVGHAVFNNPLFTPSHHYVSLPVGNCFKIFSLFLVFTSVFLKNNILSYCALLIKSNFCFYHYPFFIVMPLFSHYGLPYGSNGKASAYNAGDLGSIPESGRSSGEGNGNPLQYSCLENPMDGGAW